jgi:hypothetical protein
VHEGGKVCNLIGVHRERGHAAVGPAGADHRSNELALLIVEHELGAQQARSAVATANIGAVTERTIGTEGGTSALDGCGVFGALRIRTDADAADPSAAGRGRRLALLRRDRNR